MRRRIKAIILVLTVCIAHFLVPTASAHPLGNFTINHYAGLEFSANVVSIDYVLDMAEIPAFQAINKIDTNQNGEIDPGESSIYRSQGCGYIQSKLELRIANKDQSLLLEHSSLETPPGAGGLLTLRLSCLYRTETDVLGKAVEITFVDHSYSERIGWREIVVSGVGFDIQGKVEQQSISNRLREYPNDLLSSPLNQHEVTFHVHPIDNKTTDEVEGLSNNLEASKTLDPKRGDAFTRLIVAKQITPGFILMSILVSFIWGALHAFTPGHGKTIVAAYLVGSRGTPMHAVYLGLTTTLTHTAGIIVLGIITIFASRFILSERLFPWLNLVSGLLVIIIGLSLFLNRLKRTNFIHLPRTSRVDYRLHPISGTRHVHKNIFTQVHSHRHDHQHAQNTSFAPKFEHNHSTNYGSNQRHQYHSHLPPGADNSPVTLRSLLALGISGGLLPCPSALVVLLSAIALERVGLGLLLVVTFSLGLAGVLTLVGLLFLYAGKVFERLFGRVPAQSKIIGIVPAVSALIVAILGVGVTLRALIEIGVIRI